MSYVIPPDLRSFAARISKACQLARREGWKISPYTFRCTDEKLMCPIGAFVHFLGVPLMQDNESIDFVAGFDGIGFSPSPHYELGHEFRKRFCG
jgi:hypothetical protein